LSASENSAKKPPTVNGFHYRSETRLKSPVILGEIVTLAGSGAGATGALGEDDGGVGEDDGGVGEGMVGLG
jgi:hypothetical protein